ncbi:hypothetical protein [Streptomyces uncialis]|uniref:hypothetical protein n=1 Tax=Streptomyces uncialis TaxID=1048205 RepID=UPI00224F73C0|nr:hypothetical protein [Streptomyces uncialis]MCX4661358.1 hypothetical protein [Streptomyces uncialis]
MAKSFTTTIGGSKVELPGTIRTIREALAPELVDAFIEDVEDAGPDEVPGVLARWALRTPQAHDPGEEEQVACILDGDTSGLVYADEGDECGSAG